MANAGMTKLRATTLDRRFAGHPITVIVGPVAARDDTDLLAVLHRLWALGPAYRIGAIPSASSGRWRFVRPDVSWILSRSSVPRIADLEACLEYLFGLESAPPLVVGLIDQHLLLRFDHGISDMALVFDLLAALSTPGAADEPVLPHIRRLGGRAAVARIAAADLARAPLQWLAAIMPRSREHIEATPTVASEPMCPKVVVTRSEPGYMETLVAHRSVRSDRPTVGALLAEAISERLSEALGGIGEVHVVVSLRHRLPGGRDTAANLTAVVTVPMLPRADFTDRYTRRVQSPSVSTRLAVSALVGRLRPVRRTSTASRRVPHATLSLSNATQAALSAPIAWANDDMQQRLCLVGAPLSGPRHVTVVLTQVGMTVQAVTHLDAAAHEPELIRRAVTDALSTARWSQ